MPELLCQINFDDWAELALLAVVVIGTLVVNAVKALAARKQQQGQRTNPPIAPPLAPEAHPARQTRVDERSPRERMQTPPLAPPVPSAELRPSTQSELERLRRRARERQAEGQFVPPPPMATPRMPAEVMEVERPRAQQARLAAEQEAKRRELHRRQLAEEQSREAARRRAAERAERKAKKPESLEDREARLEKQRQARLGHVDEGLVPAEKAPAADPRVEALARRLPAITRNSLRDAVILNEILSPPLSIRD